MTKQRLRTTAGGLALAAGLLVCVPKARVAEQVINAPDAVTVAGQILLPPPAFSGSYIVNKTVDSGGQKEPQEGTRGRG